MLKKNQFYWTKFRTKEIVSIALAVLLRCLNFIFMEKTLIMGENVDLNSKKAALSF